MARPFLVARIKFLPWTLENRLRHPRFAGSAATNRPQKWCGKATARPLDHSANDADFFVHKETPAVLGAERLAPGGVELWRVRRAVGAVRT